MISKLFNPFRYIAGGKSLLIGIPLLLITALIGYLSGTNFPDLLSVKVGYTTSMPYAFVQGICNWISISTVLYIMAIVASKSKIRAVDIFGTQAIARFPYLLASLIGFFPAMGKFGQYLLWELLHQGVAIEISTLEITAAIVLIILNLLLTIWMVALMYTAFRESANIKGSKSVVLFIVGVIVATILSGLVAPLLYQNIV